MSARRGAVPLQKAWIRCGLLLVFFASGAEASVNLPLHHWVYEAIERLTAMDIIDRAMVVTKPYSRKEAAQYVARAIRRIRDDKIPLDGREVLAEPLLDRLMTELRPELVDLGVLPSVPGTKTGAIRYGARAQVEADAFSVGHGSGRLRENSMGQYYANGVQVQADLRAWIELTDAVALSADPKFISNQRALGIGATADNHNIYMQELNAKFTGGNVTFQVGRSSLWWGPGYHGSLLVTDNPFPRDMLQLGSEEPFRLPWVFRPLGYWKIQSFLQRLENNRDFPYAQVFGLRVSYLPANWLEIGLTRLTQFGGHGRGQSLYDGLLHDYFLIKHEVSGKNKANEEAMVDFTVRLPAGLQFYWEIGVEDFVDHPATLLGLYIPQVFHKSTTDLRIEYADTDLERRYFSGDSHVWYNHFLYTSGMRLKGLPLGDQIGTDATELFIRTTSYLSDNLQLGTNLNLQEREKGQPVHEKKREVALDLTWWLSSQTQITVGYTYQRITNPGQITSVTPFVETFAGGVTSTNHFLWTSLAQQF